MTRRLKVLITIDTEFWPSDPDFNSGVRQGDLKPERELQRDIFGVTPHGVFGIGRQLAVFARYGIRATYFVEGLCASVLGPGPLERVVTPILVANQDVQLHIHTEWLKVTPNTILPGRTGHHIRQFSVEEQKALLAIARDNLVAAGAGRVNAFRAGNFGASWDTLHALAAIGLTYDTSYNSGSLTGACKMPLDEPLLQPARLHDMVEVPVSVFEDLPGRVRPAQINAASIAEFRHALHEALHLGWRTFVIVTHSNELLNRRKDGPNLIALRRFEWLCAYLAEHRDHFETTTFADLDPDELTAGGASTAPIRSNALRTAARMGEQLAQRWLA